MKVEIFSRVENNKLVRNRKLLSDAISKFNNKDVAITIEKKKSKRSTQQNRWYWACINILSNHTGFTKDEMHEVVKLKFLRKEKVIETTGELIEYLGSTATLTKSEFSELVEELIRWSAETLGCVLPYPNEELTINF